MPKTVVIVGGGFAGVDCARGLERKLSADWQIVLFNAENHTTFTPLLAEVVGSSISPLHVVWTIRQTLRRTLFHTADVSAFDFAAQEIEYKLVGGRIARQKYDHLVIACGMVVNSEILPGAATQSFPLKTLGDALVLRNHLIGQLERADVEPDPEQRKQLVSFAVLGAGFSGVEVAGEIFDLLNGALRFYRTLKRSDLRVTIIQRGDRILPELPAKLGKYAHDRLVARGIEICLKTQAAAVTTAGVQLADGSTIRAGTVICTIGNTTHPLIAASGLPLERGRIRTDGDMRVIGKDNVWSLGDCAVVPNAFDGSPSPTLAQFAIRQAPQLARNISLRIAGRPTRPFNFRILGMFAAIGHRNAVGQVLGFTFDGFFAWVMWRGIYLSKMPTLARKVQIAFDWTWDLFFSRDIVELTRRETLRMPQSHFEPGEVVFRPGGPGEKYYVIEKGIAGILGPSDGEPLLHLGPGDFFGERELSGQDGGGFHVRAEKSLDVLNVEYLPFQQFLRHLRTLPTGTHERIARLEALRELRSVIDKHPGLAQAKVSDAMLSSPPTIPVASNFAAAISQFQKEGRTAFVVVDADGRLKGVCTVTDLHKALCALRSLQTPISEIMTRPVVTIAQSEPLSKAMNKFLTEPVKRLVVVADNDAAQPVGLLNLFNVVVYYASHESDFLRTARPSVEGGR